MTKEDELEQFLVQSAALTRQHMALTHVGRSHEHACMLGLVGYSLYGINKAIAHAAQEQALPSQTVFDFIRRGLAEVEFALNLVDPPGPTISGPTKLRVVR